MDNQTRNELKRQKHADDQAHIIRVRNAEIQALQAEKGRLQRALQERPEVQENPRPLTPDAITDEMVERFRAAWADRVWDGVAPHANFVRPVLAAALTEPSTRPDGAEDIEALIREAEKVGQGADDESLANYLAARLANPTRKEA